jgi:hypothetical protein
MESNKLNKREKQINRQEGKIKTNNQTKKSFKGINREHLY